MLGEEIYMWLDQKMNYLCFKKQGYAVIIEETATLNCTDLGKTQVWLASESSHKSKPIEMHSLC